MDTQLHGSSRQYREGIAVGYKTDKGRKRAGNEDSYAVFTGAELNARLDAFLVVADGMGGTKGGEIASNLVINSLPKRCRRFSPNAPARISTAVPTWLPRFSSRA